MQFHCLTNSVSVYSTSISMVHNQRTPGYHRDTYSCDTHPIIVDSSLVDRGPLCRGVLRAYLDGVNVPTLVCLDPQVLQDLVYLLHLERVEPHDGSIQRLVILLQVRDGRLCRLCEVWGWSGWAVGRVSMVGYSLVPGPTFPLGRKEGLVPIAIAWVIVRMCFELPRIIMGNHTTNVKRM